MSATRDNTLADPERLITDLQRQLSDCKAERDEALEREKASAEVLQLISRSPSEPKQVFQAILENAVRLCEAKFGVNLY
jgi:hypothetical protein